MQAVKFMHIFLTFSTVHNTPTQCLDQLPVELELAGQYANLLQLQLDCQEI